jgi:hypothetical protein
LGLLMEGFGAWRWGGFDPTMDSPVMFWCAYEVIATYNVQGWLTLIFVAAKQHAADLCHDS